MITLEREDAQAIYNYLQLKPKHDIEDILGFLKVALSADNECIKIPREYAQGSYETILTDYIDHFKKRGDIMKLSEEYLERDRKLSRLISSLAFKLNRSDND